jgi:4-hydroxy-tetrahydrodipicolinate synthase
VVEAAVARCGRRVPVIAGVGASGTLEAARLTAAAAAAGAAAVMVPPPFYAPAFFSSAPGMIEHFSTVADAARPIEVMLYDGGGGVEIPVEVTAQLARSFPNVTMVKLTVPSPQKVTAIRAATEGAVRVLCGNDALTLYELSLGVDGVAIGVGNIVPREVTEVVHGFLAGRREEARSSFYQHVLPVASIALCSTPEFVQVFKAALTSMDIIASPHVRSPLQRLDAARIAETEAALRHVGVLSRP